MDAQTGRLSWIEVQAGALAAKAQEGDVTSIWQLARSLRKFATMHKATQALVHHEDGKLVRDKN